MRGDFGSANSVICRIRDWLILISIYFFVLFCVVCVVLCAVQMLTGCNRLAGTCGLLSFPGETPAGGGRSG